MVLLGEVDSHRKQALPDSADLRAGEVLCCLLARTPDCIALLEPDGTIDLMSDAGASLLGNAENFLECLTERDRLSMEQDLRENGKWHGEILLTGGQGRIPLELHASLVGERILVIANDLRSQRRMEQDLQRLRRRLSMAHEDERRRIARDLHDDITQKLAILSVELSGLGKNAESLSPELGEALHRLRGNLIGISEDVRNVCHELHPGILERVGLAELLRSYCRERQRLTGTLWEVIARDLPSDIPKDAQLTLYRIAQAAIRNVVKHSGATHATLVLSAKEGMLRLSVIDNGCGFLVDNVKERQGLGLTGIEERARSMGGSLQLDSVAGEGTRLVVEIPFQDGEG